MNIKIVATVILYLTHQCLSFFAISAKIYCPRLGMLGTNGLNTIVNFITFQVKQTHSV